MQWPPAPCPRNKSPSRKTSHSPADRLKTRKPGDNPTIQPPAKDWKGDLVIISGCPADPTSRKRCADAQPVLCAKDTADPSSEYLICLLTALVCPKWLRQKHAVARGVRAAAFNQERNAVGHLRLRTNGSKASGNGLGSIGANDISAPAQYEIPRIGQSFHSAHSNPPAPIAG